MSAFLAQLLGSSGSPTSDGAKTSPANSQANAANGGSAPAGLPGKDQALAKAQSAYDDLA